MLLVFLHKVLPYVTSYKLTIFLLTLLLQTVPAFLFILDVNHLGLVAFFNNKSPVWARPYTYPHTTQPPSIPPKIDPNPFGVSPPPAAGVTRLI